MNKTAGMMLVEGNAAAALGCMMAGVTVVAWYPITPSSSLPETLIEYMKKYRIDKATGKATFAIVQAEDEIASIGMVVGAGWAGARAMTSTSGPRHLADGRVRRPGVLRRDSRRGLRHPARGAVDRPADAHRAGGHPHGRDALARRHQADPADSVVGRRVLHDGDGGVRPGRALPDAGVRHERSGSGDEHLDGGSVRLSGQAARSRQAARRRGAPAAGRVGPLPRRGRRRHSVPHDSRRRHAGVFHARVRPQRQGPVQRAARRLRRQHGAAGAEVRDRAALRPAARGDRSAGRRDRDHRLRHEPLGDRREPRSARAGDRHSRPRPSGSARIRSPRISAPSSTGTSASTSSSRTAMRRC